VNHLDAPTVSDVDSGGTHENGAIRVDVERDLKQGAAQAEVEVINVVEGKVKAASTAAAVTGFAVNLLSRYAFHGAVPGWATALVSAIVVGLLTFVAGWLAKHAPRTVAKQPTAS
jgi:hypothetical protein